MPNHELARGLSKQRRENGDGGERRVGLPSLPQTRAICPRGVRVAAQTGRSVGRRGGGEPAGLCEEGPGRVEMTLVM